MLKYGFHSEFAHMTATSSSRAWSIRAPTRQCPQSAISGGRLTHLQGGIVGLLSLYCHECHSAQVAAVAPEQASHGKDTSAGFWPPSHVHRNVQGASQPFICHYPARLQKVHWRELFCQISENPTSPRSSCHSESVWGRTPTWILNDISRSISFRIASSIASESRHNS